MPAFTITRTGARRPVVPFKPVARHPQAKIITDEVVIKLPFAPVEVQHSGWADSFAVVERTGRKPLVIFNADGLKVCSFSILLAHRDHQKPVEGLLTKLRGIAASGDLVTLSLSALEAGTQWHLTDLTVSTQGRQQGTNAVTRATCNLTFTEREDAVANVGPVSGGKKNKKGGKGKKGDKKGGKGPERRHKVRVGESLASVALTYYGDPNAWAAIATASGIRNPRKVKVGTVLTIPSA